MATATATPQRTATRRRHLPAFTSDGNVGDAERLVSLLGGGTLVIYGLSRKSLGGLALAAAGGALAFRGATGHCNLYGALGLSTAAPEGPNASVPARRGVKVEKSFTINRPAEDLFRFWRDFTDLPLVMTHLESVTVHGNRSHWVAKGPLGVKAEWDAEIINERPNELIAWRSVPGSVVDTAGSVHFTPAPGGRGTEVRVVLKYLPPGGKVSAAVAWLFGDSGAQAVAEDLRHFKQFMEAGEIPTTQGQTSCRE